MDTVGNFIFLGSKINEDGDCSHEIKRCLLLGGKATTHLDSILKIRDITLLTKVCLVKYGFSSSHVSMWDLDYKGNWVSNNWYFQAVVLKKTPKSPLDCKEIKPVNSKGNKSGIFTRKTDAEAPVPILRYLMQRADSLKKILILERLKARGVETAKYKILE